MRYFILLVIFAAARVFGAEPPSDYASLKADAEKFYADKSYSKAHELYARARAMSNISSNEARWVAFRSYDTQWRAEASTQSADDTRIEQARSELDKMVRDVSRTEDRNPFRFYSIVDLRRYSVTQMFWNASLKMARMI